MSGPPDDAPAPDPPGGAPRPGDDPIAAPRRRNEGPATGSAGDAPGAAPAGDIAAPGPADDAVRDALRRALLYPERVALIGASGSPGRLTARPVEFLRRHGFRGEVIPVNPGRAEVGGLRAYPGLEDVPGPVDHAYVLLDAEPALDALEACGRAGVRVASVLADGFGEAGEAGAARQRRLEAIAARWGMTVIGPNSTGVVETSRGFACTTNAAFAAETLPRGRTAVLSQSGSVIGAIASRGAATGIGFHALVSVGNEAVLGVGEIGALLVDDPAVEGFALFLETVRRPLAVAAFAARARALGKPVTAYLLGRSAAGRALAVSHTGAMVGGARAMEAFLAGHGIALAETFDALVESAALPVLRPRLMGRPRRATVVTTTGGGGGMLLDRLGMRGVPLDGAAAGRLAAAGLPVKDGPLVDLTLAGTRYEVMRAVVEALARDPGTGLVTVAIGSSAQFEPGLAVEPIADAVAAAGPSAAPVIAVPIPHAPESLGLLNARGVPAFRSVESAAEVVALLLRPPLGEAPAPLPPDPALRAALDAFPEVGTLDEWESSILLLGALGVTRPPTLRLGPEEPAPERVPFSGPFVLKAVSRALPHKTERGAVVLALPDLGAVEGALAAMRARLAGEAVAGFLLQPVMHGVGEAVIGFLRDPVVGPLISVGAGGVLAELHDDAALRPAPVTPSIARAMVEEPRGLAPLRGHRGLPPGDLDALAEAVAALSRLAAEPRVLEAEVNPVLVRGAGQGVVALDALVRLGPTTGHA